MMLYGSIKEINDHEKKIKNFHDIFNNFPSRSWSSCSGSGSSRYQRNCVMSDGKTQAPTGTHFSVNDTANSYRMEGNTGGPPGMSGRYSVPLSGEDGDEVILRAWNETHHGTRTIILSGDMTGIDIVLNTPRDNLTAVDATTQKKIR